MPSERSPEPSGDPLGPAFGAYVHIPFCARRCEYCAFATWTDRGHLVDAYLGALRTEITRAVVEGIPRSTSVFFGGGTPSLVDPLGLASVLAALPREPDAEVTVECNPDTVSAALLETYHRAGVTRLSFGVQSMVPDVLRSLGRTHDPESVHRAVSLARRAGFTNFNIDLIYGAAGETLADWERTLDEALDLDPPHVSAYGLTVEAGTPLFSDPDRHPDDDDQADKYLLASERLPGAGLAWYEISNWARAGSECRHNLLYWRQGNYRGFGCAAHSHSDGRRWWNVRTPERYIAAVVEGRSAEAGHEVLDVEARRLEGLQLALRTSSGVPVSAFGPADLEALGPLVEVRPDRAVLTVPGRLMANEAAVRIR